jgi:hypothetical protein
VEGLTWVAWILPASDLLIWLESLAPPPVLPLLEALESEEGMVGGEAGVIVLIKLGEVWY